MIRIVSPRMLLVTRVRRAVVGVPSPAAGTQNERIIRINALLKRGGSPTTSMLLVTRMPVSRTRKFGNAGTPTAAPGTPIAASGNTNSGAV